MTSAPQRTPFICSRKVTLLSWKYLDECRAHDSGNSTQHEEDDISDACGTGEGFRLRGTCHPRHGSGCRHQRLAAARRDGGRVKRSRRFCYLAKSPTLLTPEEAISLAVESHRSAKNATDNHLSAEVFLFTPAPPLQISSPIGKSLPSWCIGK